VLGSRRSGRVDVQDLAGDERPGGFQVEDAAYHVADLADVPNEMQLREGRMGFRRVGARPVRGEAAVKISFPQSAIGPPSACRISLVTWDRGFSRARRRA
jgi:hypothetical protein